MMEIFRHMTNDCIRIGLQSNVSTMKKLCQLSYRTLSKYDIVSYYKLHAISKAAGILASRKKSIKRGIVTKNPYLIRSHLVSCYGFKIIDSFLKIPLGDKEYFDIQLTTYTQQILSDPGLKIRSFTLTPEKLSICYSKQIIQKQYADTVGIDRNLRNITVGNSNEITQYNLSKTLQIAETTTNIIKSFKRNDRRIQQKINKKYGSRRRNRVKQFLHHTSKRIVSQAEINKTVLVFEDIRGIRKLYRKGNGQKRNYRRKMNGWSFAEIKRQIEYKAAWSGIPVIQLTNNETKGTSTLCPRCGERLQVGQSKRGLWCENCKRELNRDVVAAMNISYRGLARLASSKGSANEAMVQEPTLQSLVILKVDADKSISRHPPKI